MAGLSEQPRLEKSFKIIGRIEGMMKFKIIFDKLTMLLDDYIMI